jgi:hypothetical protein
VTAAQSAHKPHYASWVATGRQRSIQAATSRDSAGRTGASAHGPSPHSCACWGRDRHRLLQDPPAVTDDRVVLHTVLDRTIPVELSSDRIVPAIAVDVLIALLQLRRRPVGTRGWSRVRFPSGRLCQSLPDPQAPFPGHPPGPGVSIGRRSTSETGGWPEGRWTACGRWSRSGHRADDTGRRYSCRVDDPTYALGRSGASGGYSDSRKEASPRSRSLMSSMKPCVSSVNPFCKISDCTDKTLSLGAVSTRYWPPVLLAPAAAR